MMVKAIYGRQMVWGESVTEHEHQVGLAAYEAAIGAGLRGIYPDARISVQGEGHDSAARVTVDGVDVSETPRVERVLDDAFHAACGAISALDRRIRALRDEAAAAGDHAQVALCDAALHGDETAHARCIDALQTDESAVRYELRVTGPSPRLRALTGMLHQVRSCGPWSSTLAAFDAMANSDGANTDPRWTADGWYELAVYRVDEDGDALRVVGAILPPRGTR